ncbi:MAG: VanZ family protein [Bacteroidota bacterium]
MENKLKKVLQVYRTPLYFGWVLFIGLLTLIPGGVISGVDWNFLSIDKMIHFIMFLVLAFLGANFFININKPFTIFFAISASLIIAVGYGSIIEYTQTFIPKRGFDYADLSANIIGALAGLATFYLYSIKK